MVGKDAIRYHSQLHGAVHYTDNITQHYPTSAVWLSGSAADPQGNRDRPFLGHMFIQGCVSADGWLNNDGSCVRLARSQPPCRGVKVCGDHMQGYLHFSHMKLTNDTAYDFRNAIVSFEHDKQTFKTIICDFDRPFAHSLHITTTDVKPGCVSTLKIVVPESSRAGSVKLTWHPALKWLTERPRLVTRGFIAIISFESYGDKTQDVYCSYREECFEVCDNTLQCTQSGLSGFDTVEGSETDVLSGLNVTESVSSCWAPLEFVPWLDDCGTTYTVTLTTGQEITQFYNFEDYYTDDIGGTRIWNWDKSDKYNITGEPQLTTPQVTRFTVRVQPTQTKNRVIPVSPDYRLYQGDYVLKNTTPLSGELVFDTLSSYDSDFDRAIYVPADDMYVVPHSRSRGTGYILKLTCPVGQTEVTAKVTVTCPERVIRYRYYPKY